tara:strand:- start:369 stop:749 length:381 start_codon:yes stop_codon:yes gene_type:complete
MSINEITLTEIATWEYNEPKLYSEKLIEILSKAPRSDGSLEMSTELNELDDTYVDHWGVRSENIDGVSKAPFKYTIEVTEHAKKEKSVAEPSNWLLVSWKDYATKSTRMTAIIWDAHCHAYAVRVI